MLDPHDSTYAVTHTAECRVKGIAAHINQAKLHAEMLDYQLTLVRRQSNPINPFNSFGLLINAADFKVCFDWLKCCRVCLFMALTDK